MFSDVYAKEESPAEGSGLLRRICTRQQITDTVQAVGFRMILFRDCGDILKGMLGQLILDYGAEEAYRHIGLTPCALKSARAGYFLAVAIKE